MHNVHIMQHALDAAATVCSIFRVCCSSMITNWICRSYSPKYEWQTVEPFSGVLIVLTIKASDRTYPIQNARCSFGEAVLGQSFGTGPCFFSGGAT
jgi:hypothetical protein